MCSNVQIAAAAAAAAMMTSIDCNGVQQIVTAMNSESEQQ